MNLEREPRTDWKRVDGILDAAESSFVNVIGDINLERKRKHQKKIVFTSERYRWDEPVITFSWKDKDIFRSVAIDVDGRSVNIEINAWKDVGEDKVRHWLNELMGKAVSGSPREYELLLRSVQIVSSLRLADLKRFHPLSRGAGN